VVTEREDFVVVNPELMRHIDAEALRSNLQGAIEDQKDACAVITSILTKEKLQNSFLAFIITTYIQYTVYSCG